jgi:hypothetical protein
MMEPHDLPTREPDDGVASATQLSILLASATSAIDEEFRRAERLDAKSRNQTTMRYTQMLWMGLKMKAAYLPGC